MKDFFLQFFRSLLSLQTSLTIRFEQKEKQKNADLNSRKITKDLRQTNRQRRKAIEDRRRLKEIPHCVNLSIPTAHS